MAEIQQIIEQAFENRAEINPGNVDAGTRNAVLEAIDLLDSGRERVAEPVAGGWQVNEWLKKAVLLSFRIRENQIMPGGFTQYFDKVDSKFDGCAVARKGSFVAPGVVMMPSYVNIGAYVDSGTMVDTWATVGSCAQIGTNDHLSGGVGIGGVLEPLQASPTIIEDNCFIGARSEVVEGVIVEKNSVISMGVYIGQSTKIYNRETDEVTYGRIPTGSVVVAGNLPSENGKYSLYCAVIVKQVDEKTRAKVGINELIRNI